MKVLVIWNGEKMGLPLWKFSHGGFRGTIVVDSWQLLKVSVPPVEIKVGSFNFTVCCDPETLKSSNSFFYLLFVIGTFITVINLLLRLVYSDQVVRRSQVRFFLKKTSHTVAITRLTINQHAVETSAVKNTSDNR